jgi:hypothetical protein
MSLGKVAKYCIIWCWFRDVRHQIAFQLGQNLQLEAVDPALSS